MSVKTFRHLSVFLKGIAEPAEFILEAGRGHWGYDAQFLNVHKDDGEAVWIPIDKVESVAMTIQAKEA